MRWLIIAFLFFNLTAQANDSTKLYNPYANVVKDVLAAVEKAKKEKKQVMLQIGGNWCVWCYRFNSFVQLDSNLKRLLDDNYVVYHLNYSKENKNLDYLKKLGFPQRFGFPVIVILDAEGNRIHTQDSSLLEKGNGYDTDKVKTFFKSWARGAFEEILYKE
jgi:thioredoxin-related protein